MSKKYYVNQNTNRIRKAKFNDSDIYKNLNKKNSTQIGRASCRERV